MFCIIYTPTEGDAIQNFSRLFRRPEGCFLNIDDQDRVYHDLAQWGNPEDIDYIVVTGTLKVKIIGSNYIANNLEQIVRKSLVCVVTLSIDL